MANHDHGIHADPMGWKWVKLPMNLPYDWGNIHKSQFFSLAGSQGVMTQLAIFSRPKLGGAIPWRTPAGILWNRPRNWSVSEKIPRGFPLFPFKNRIIDLQQRCFTCPSRHRGSVSAKVVPRRDIPSFSSHLWLQLCKVFSFCYSYRLAIDLWWFIMIYHDLSWFIMIYHDL